MTEEPPNTQTEVMNAVKKVFSAVRFTKPIPTTLLNGLAVIKLVSMFEDSLLPTDMMMVDWLNQLIETKLIYYRQLYRLRLPDDNDTRDEVMDALRRDFYSANEHLEVWSILYHRYVRVDLNISTDELEDITANSERTLRRRQKKGYKWLSEEILWLESRFHRVFEW